MFREFQDSYPNYASIYTDGSTSRDGNGCAVIYPNHTMLYKLPSYFTIFSCELFAIKEAFLNILQSKEYTYYLIFTDSLSAVTAIQDRSTHNCLVQEIQILYSEAIRTKKAVILAWIPSHVGIPGNDQADCS